ncbi:PAS domain S-box protein, partial [Acinetobacter baumannii]
MQRALEGEAQVHEWTHRDSFGRDLICEVRLVRMPSGTQRLVRGSIADISDRKRTERIAAAEREIFEQLTTNASLQEVLVSITRL